MDDVNDDSVVSRRAVVLAKYENTICWSDGGGGGGGDDDDAGKMKTSHA
jgi:hypothetical protein